VGGLPVPPCLPQPESPCWVQAALRPPARKHGNVGEGGCCSCSRPSTARIARHQRQQSKKRESACSQSRQFALSSQAGCPVMLVVLWF